MPPGRSLLLFTRLARVPGYEHSGKAQQYQRERYRAPPVLPEGTKAVGALTPGPEDAEKQENGADHLANPTHSPQAILRLLSLAGAPFRRGRGVPAVARSSPADKTAVDDEIDTGARARGVGGEKGGRPSGLAQLHHATHRGLRLRYVLSRAVPGEFYGSEGSPPERNGRAKAQVAVDVAVSCAETLRLLE